MDICWKFLRNHLQNLSAAGVHYYASVNFIQYNLHFFSNGLTGFLAIFRTYNFTAGKRGKGGGKQDSLPSLPPSSFLSLPHCFLNQKQKNKKTRRDRTDA